MRREDEKDEAHTLLTTEKKAFIHHCNNSDSKANKANVQKRSEKLRRRRTRVNVLAELAEPGKTAATSEETTQHSLLHVNQLSCVNQLC